MDLDSAVGRAVLHPGVGPNAGSAADLRRVAAVSGVRRSTRRSTLAPRACVRSSGVRAGGHAGHLDGARHRRQRSLQLQVLRLQRIDLERRPRLGRLEHVDLVAAVARHVLVPGVAAQQRVGGRLRRLHERRAGERHVRDAAHHRQRHVSPGAPLVANGPATVVTTARGGTGPYRYKYWVYNGSTWSVGRDWDASNTWQWAPPAGGTYYLQVWVQNTGGGTGYNAYRQIGPIAVNP